MPSIVIPVFNKHEMAQDCLTSIRANTQDYELILVDNGSTPPIPFATIRNEKNLGFPVAVNQGIRAAKGETIILLNNDVIVTPGWAKKLTDKIENPEATEFKDIIKGHISIEGRYSIVSPVANFAAGIQRVTVPVYHNEVELGWVAEKWAKDHAGESQEVDWVIGFCMAFKRSLYGELGPFDESIWPCPGEELDFCLRAREAGYRIGIALDVYVHHFGSQTFKDLEKSGQVKYQELCDRNEKHVKAKHGEFWTKQLIEEAA